MDKVLTNFLLFLGICFLLYLLLNNFNRLEGMTTNKSTNNPSMSTGIAGNAANFVAQIKVETVKLQDQLLMTKYKKDYESAIMALDDLVDNLMLKTALSVDKSDPQKSLIMLNKLNDSKTALNSVMEFIDGK